MARYSNRIVVRQKEIAIFVRNRSCYDGAWSITAGNYQTIAYVSEFKGRNCFLMLLESIQCGNVMFLSYSPRPRYAPVRVGKVGRRGALDCGNPSSSAAV